MRIDIVNGYEQPVVPGFYHMVWGDPDNNPHGDGNYDYVRVLPAGPDTCLVLDEDVNGNVRAAKYHYRFGETLTDAIRLMRSAEDKRDTELVLWCLEHEIINRH